MPVNAEDIKAILKKNGWQFNWKKEYKTTARQLFKLVIRDQSQVQCLISLQDMTSDRYVNMYLIETAPHNLGRNKLFLGAPANLVAFACKMSFELGYDGFVAFDAKTKLIEHYRETLGAQLIMGHSRMGIFPMQAEILVNSYFNESRNEKQKGLS